MSGGADHAIPVQYAAMPVGSLRLADLGFYDLGMFKTLDQAADHRLTRLQRHSRIRQPGRKEQSILEVVIALGKVAPGKSGDCRQRSSPARTLIGPAGD